MADLTNPELGEQWRDIFNGAKGTLLREDCGRLAVDSNNVAGGQLGCMRHGLDLGLAIGPKNTIGEYL